MSENNEIMKMKMKIIMKNNERNNNNNKWNEIMNINNNDNE